MALKDMTEPERATADIVPISSARIRELPQFLIAQPEISTAFVVDARLPMESFIRAQVDAGLSVCNMRDGRLVITDRPEDFRSQR